MFKQSEVDPELSAAPVPQVQIIPTPAAGKRGPVGTAPRTNYSRVNTGVPETPDAGATYQKSMEPKLAIASNQLINEVSMNTMAARPTLQQMLKNAMAGATLGSTKIAQEAQRQLENLDGVSGQQGGTQQPELAEEKVSSAYARKLASAVEYCAELIKSGADLAGPWNPSDHSNVLPGFGPGALRVTEAPDGPPPSDNVGHATSGNLPPMHPAMLAHGQLANDLDHRPGADAEAGWAPMGDNSKLSMVQRIRKTASAMQKEAVVLLGTGGQHVPDPTANLSLVGAPAHMRAGLAESLTAAPAPREVVQPGGLAPPESILVGPSGRPLREELVEKALAAEPAPIPPSGLVDSGGRPIPPVTPPEDKFVPTLDRGFVLKSELDKELAKKLEAALPSQIIVPQTSTPVNVRTPEEIAEMRRVMDEVANRMNAPRKAPATVAERPHKAPAAAAKKPAATSPAGRVVAERPGRLSRAAHAYMEAVKGKRGPGYQAAAVGIPAAVLSAGLGYGAYRMAGGGDETAKTSMAYRRKTAGPVSDYFVGGVPGVHLGEKARRAGVYDQQEVALYPQLTGLAGLGVGTLGGAGLGALTGAAAGGPEGALPGALIGGLGGALAGTLGGVGYGWYKKNRELDDLIAAREAAAREAASKQASVRDIRRMASLYKMAEDAINPARISAGPARMPDTIEADQSGPGATYKGLVPTDPRAVANFTRREAKAPMKREMDQYLDEPMMSESTDRVLANVFGHTDEAGAKISSAQEVSKVAAARALMRQLAESAGVNPVTFK